VITYHIEHSFIHFNTKEKMYRVKRTFEFGGLDFIVCTEEQLKLLRIEES